MTQSKPFITRTTRPLPFDQLPWDDFERLCLWLVEREGYERAERVPQDPDDEPASVLLARIRAAEISAVIRQRRFTLPKRAALIIGWLCF